jgi:Flp pilus assembly protein CpaB
MVTDQDSGSKRLAPFDQPPVVRRSLLTRIKLGHVVMVLAALLALVFNVAVLRGNQATTTVAIAAVDIGAGTAIGEDHFTGVAIPADVAFADQFVRVDDLTAHFGRLTTRPIAAGSPILVEDLRPAESTNGLRSMSIPIDRARAVGGTIAVGDSVDVVLVVDGLASYVVTGVEVIDAPAADSNVLGAGDRYAPTVAVDAEQALRIAAALDTGSVHLIRATGTAAPESGAARALSGEDGAG